MDKKELNKYFNYSKDSGNLSVPDFKICEDCFYKIDNKNGICRIYRLCKPLKVIEKGICDEYKKQ